MIKSICNHCYKFGPVYEVGKRLLCSDHRELKQYAPKEVKKPKRIKSISDNRKVDNKDYMLIRNEYLIKHPMCECLCGEFSTEVHHKAGKIGALLTDSNTFMAVSRQCHTEIHSNHSYALDHGFIWSIEQTNSYLKNKKV